MMTWPGISVHISEDFTGLKALVVQKYSFVPFGFMVEQGVP